MTTQSVFLDTSFLVSTQMEAHAFHETSLSILKPLIASSSKVTLATCPLVFDEFWYVLLGLWKSGPDLSKNFVREKLLLATNNVFRFRNFKLLPTVLTEKDLLSNIELMFKFGLRSRDALIASIMKKEGIKKIASFDTDFDKVSSITRIFE